MARTQEEVQIVVTARDEATKTMKGIGTAISTAVGTFTGGAALKGFEALSGAIMGGISDARGHQREMAQTQAVITSTGGAAGFSAEQIEAMADALGTVSGKSLFDAGDIQQGENMLLTFTNIKETLPDATAVMVDMATAMGTDVAGGAIQLGKALNDPIAGIGALSRVGVTFTDEQKAVIQSLVDTGNMAGAQQVILAELNKEFGGSAAAAAAADGGWSQLRDTWRELAEGVGAQILPIINGITTGLNTMMTAFKEGGLTGLWALVGPALAEFATNTVTWIQNQGPIWAAQLVTWGQAFIDWVAPMIPPALAALGKLATDLGAWIVRQAPIWVAKLLAWGEAFVNWLAPMIPPLLAKAAELARQFIGWIGDQAAPILSKLGDWAASLVAWIVPATKDFLAKWPVMFDQFLTWIGNAAGPLLVKLGDWAVSFVAWVIPMIPGFIVAVGGIAAALLIWVGETAVVLLTKIVTEWVPAFINWIADSVIPKLGPALQAIISEIGAWITGTALPWAVDALKGVGAAIVQGLIDGINSMIEQARRVLNEVIGIINSIPVLPNIPTLGGGQSSGGSPGFGGSSVGGSSVTINQSFGAGTAGSIRQQARLGATQGIRAASRSQGLT